MKKNLLIILSLFFILSNFSCKSKKMDKKEIEVEKNLNKTTKEILSPDKSKKLVLVYVEGFNPRIEFSYSVLNTKTKKELLKGSFTGLKMEWNNNNSIKGYLFQGMVPENDSADDSSKFKIIEIN